MGNYFLAMKPSVFVDVLLVKLKPGLTHWQPKKAGAVRCQWSRAKLNESLTCVEENRMPGVDASSNSVSRRKSGAPDVTKATTSINERSEAEAYPEAAL